MTVVSATAKTIISTHTLRKEGDITSVKIEYDYYVFQPTPSARRVTMIELRTRQHSRISTHTLRKEGDSHVLTAYLAHEVFQPTPSARRVTLM